MGLYGVSGVFTVKGTPARGWMVRDSWHTGPPGPPSHSLTMVRRTLCLRIYFRQTSSSSCDKPRLDTRRSTEGQRPVAAGRHVHVSLLPTCLWHPAHLPARLTSSTCLQVYYCPNLSRFIAQLPPPTHVIRPFLCTTCMYHTRHYQPGYSSLSVNLGVGQLKGKGEKKKRGGATRQGIRWRSHRGWSSSLLLLLLLLFVAGGGCCLLLFISAYFLDALLSFFFFSLPSYCLHSLHVSNPCIDRLNCRRTHPDGSLLGYTRCHIPGSTCRDFH